MGTVNDLAKTMLGHARWHAGSAESYMRSVVNNVFSHLQQEDEMDFTALEKLISDIDSHVSGLSELRDNATQLLADIKAQAEQVKTDVAKAIDADLGKVEEAVTTTAPVSEPPTEPPAPPVSEATTTEPATSTEPTTTSTPTDTVVTEPVAEPAPVADTPPAAL